MTTQPRSPYVGLVPYDEGDAAFFFGRSTEAAIVAMNLRTARLTILYGPSGVGKSSLLMAGAVHSLRLESAAGEAERLFAVGVFPGRHWSWRDDPVPGIAEVAREALQGLPGAEPLLSPAPTLAETLQAWTAGQTLLLALDQFEEYFQYHPGDGDDDELTGFAAELARIVNDPALTVNVLLSIREDAWAKLDRFEGHIPSLFANYVRIDHLDLAAAREAVEGPIAAWNRSLPAGGQPYAIEPALVEAVLSATAGGSLSLTADTEAGEGEARGDRVEAPFLQLVLDRLWRETVAAGERTLTLARLEALGGAAKIVENHLLDALGRFSPSELDVASECFRFLVSRSKTKIAHSAADLAEWTGRSEPEVIAVLDKLCTGESGRILRPVAPAQGEEGTSYELFHDILAEPILAWRARHEQERKREAERQRHRAARRRLIGIVAVLVVIALVLAGFTGWALHERSTAQGATASATSLALVTAAGDQQRTHHPDLALLLSLAAYRTSPTLEAKDSMISALEQAAGTILRSGRQPVYGVAFSRDGRRLVSASLDGKLRLWDATTLEPEGSLLVGRGTGAKAAAFSPDGRRIAAADDSGRVVLIDVNSHAPIGSPLRGPRGASGVAFSPDRQLLAVSGDGGKVTTWDLSNPAHPSRSLRGHRGFVAAVAFSPDRQTLATAGYDGTLRLWDAHTGRELQAVNGSQGKLHGVAFSRDGRRLATVGDDGTIALRDPRTGRPRTLLHGPRGVLYDVAFGANGRVVAAVAAGGSARIWDVRTGRLLGPPLAGNDGPLRTVAVSPDGRTLVAGGDGGAVLVWTVPPSGRRRGAVNGVALAASPGTTGNLLASAGDDGASLWNPRTGNPETLSGDTRQRPLHGVAFSSDEQKLAAGGDQGAALLWNVSAHRQPMRLPVAPVGTTIASVAFSPDGHTLAAGAGDGKVDLVDIETHDGRSLDGRQEIVNSVAFSPDGRRLASGGSDGTVLLWALRAPAEPEKKLISEDVERPVTAVAFSPDGRTLAAATLDGVVRLWNLGTDSRPSLLNTATSPNSPSFLTGLAFSSDGGTIVTASGDGNVRLWDVRSHKQLGRPLDGHVGALNAIAVGPDGRGLAAGGLNGTAFWKGILWPDREDLRAQVCARVVGELSEDEWRALVPGLAYRTICPA